MSNNKQITGNIGLYHVARELSREGWNVMPTMRNAKGADMLAVSEDERTVHPIQVKAHSAKPQDVLLGLHPDRYVTPWWVFVAFARSAEPVCYVIHLSEILSLKTRDPGTRSAKAEHERLFWFHRRYYTPGSSEELVETRNAWHRLGLARIT